MSRTYLPTGSRFSSPRTAGRLRPFLRREDILIVLELFAASQQHTYNRWEVNKGKPKEETLAGKENMVFLQNVQFVLFRSSSHKDVLVLGVRLHCL